MTLDTSQLTAAADAARERYEAVRDRGHTALVALTAARTGLNDAETVRAAAGKALDALADAHVAGRAATHKAVSGALCALADAEARVRWSVAIVTAAQRALQAAQADLVTTERAAMDTAETARKASLHSRVLALAAGQA